MNADVRTAERSTIVGYSFIFLLLAIAVIIVNTVVPLYTDDFCRYSAQNLDPGYVFQSVIDEWYTWTGRSVVAVCWHLALGLIQMVGPWTFGVLNLLALGGLTIGIFLISTGTAPQTTRRDLQFVLLIVVGLFFLISCFGEAYYWKTGSINYTWVMAASLFVLHPFFLLIENPADRLTLRQFTWAGLWIPLSAMGLENISVSVVAAMFMALAAQQYAARRFRPVDKLAVALTVFYAVLLGISIIAPGNQIRAAGMVAGGEQTSDIFHKLPLFTMAVGVHYLLNFLLPTLTVFSLLVKQQQTHLMRLVGLVTLFLLVTFALLGQPKVIFHDRTAFASEIMLLCILVHRLYFTVPNGLVYSIVMKPVTTGALTIALMLALVSDFHFYRAIQQKVDERADLIAHGTTLIPPLHDYQHLDDGRRIVFDLTTDPKHWENTCTARVTGATELKLDMRGRPELVSPTPHEEICRFMKGYQDISAVNKIWTLGRCQEST